MICAPSAAVVKKRWKPKPCQDPLGPGRLRAAPRPEGAAGARDGLPGDGGPGPAGARRGPRRHGAPRDAVPGLLLLQAPREPGRLRGAGRPGGAPEARGEPQLVGGQGRRRARRRAGRHYVMLCYLIVYYVILYYVMLYCIVLYYNIQYCIILL